MDSWFSSAWSGLLDFLWAPTCPVCSGSHSFGICSGCLAGIALIPRTERELATEGLRVPVVSVYRYEDPVRALILSLKYGRATHVAPALARAMATELGTWIENRHFDLVVPVPLAPRRERERGFNQAAALALPIARQFGLRHDQHALRRVRSTPPQASLSGRSRRTNLQGAFEADRVFARAVLLVDDVYTTGTTLEECARSLYAAGARRVHGLTVSRANQV